MAEYKVAEFEDGLTEIFLIYDVSPPRATGVRVRNRAPWIFHAEAQRNNGNWVGGNFNPGTDVTLNIPTNQFTVTIVNGEPDVLPNYQGWYVDKP